MFSKELLRAFQMRRHHLTPETKGREKRDIVMILKDVGGLPWSAPIYHRMATWERGWLPQLEWEEKKIVEGRFFGGTLQYVPAEEVPIYYQALTLKIELNNADLRVLDFIEAHGPLSRDEIIGGISLSKKAIEESLRRLDLSFRIARCGWAESRTWGQPLWDACERWLPKEIDLESIEPERAKEELLLKFLKSNGPLSIFQLASLFKSSLKPKELEQILERLEVRHMIVSGSFVEGISEEQYAIEEDVALLSSEARGAEGAFQQEFACILGQGDPFVTVWSQQLLELFGMRRPSAQGPAWLAYIFLNEAPVGVVDYKWRVERSQINDLRLLPECYDKDSLVMILKALEGEAKLMEHKRVEIYNINDSPAWFYLKTLLGEVLLGEGYSLEDGRFSKHLEGNLDGQENCSLS